MEEIIESKKYIELQVLPAIYCEGYKLPGSNFSIDLDDKNTQLIKAVEEATNNFDGRLVILIQKDPSKLPQTEHDFLEYGLLVRKSPTIARNNGLYKIRVECKSRVKIVDYLTTESAYMVEAIEVKDLHEDVEKELALIKKVKKEYHDRMADPSFDRYKAVNINFETISGGALADTLAPGLAISSSELGEYVNTLSVNSRLLLILRDFKKMEISKDLDRDIEDAVRRSMGDAQKEYILREKLKAIQDQLGDKVKKDEDIEDIRKKILDAKMPASMEEKALKELAKYSSTSSQSPESNIIRNYLDFICDLPWSTQSTDNEDLNLVKQKLDEDHYGLEKVKDRIIEYLAVKIKTRQNPQTILCLAGPPGTGKTSIAISIARALGRKFVKQSLGGVRDEAEIRGHRRTYIGALPGRILNGMKEVKTINPVFLLDEIDKMGSDYKGDPSDAMLEVLDPTQNANFSDHYLEEPYDLSQVLFITTANYIENIPAPLYDRMEIIELSSYTEHEKFQIAKNYLIDKQLKEHGSNRNEFSITDEAIYYLIQHYTREAGVRNLQRLIGSLIRKTIKELLMDKVPAVQITVANISNYLGKPVFNHNEVNAKKTIGKVTGLAYTQYGGDTLPIEVTYYHGRGGIVLTGKLGDVMKESAMIAISYIKSMADYFKIDPVIFNESDFHIHAPEGAVPKDGPSAGITIASAVYSAVTKKPIKSFLGMTGEITLSGEVLPIGGLREKSIAAVRSGLKEILIPKDNEKDLVDIPEEVKGKLKISLVANVIEVIEHAFKNSK